MNQSQIVESSQEMSVGDWKTAAAGNAALRRLGGSRVSAMSNYAALNKSGGGPGIISNTQSER